MDRIEFFRQIEQAIPRDRMPDIEKAVAFAEKAHSGHRRLTGEEYVEHPLRIALILADWKLDSETIIAGILHDVIEDSDFQAEDIRKEFGNYAFSFRFTFISSTAVLDIKAL